MCRGYEGNTDVTERSPSWAWCAGNAVSTVSDLTTWIRAVGSGRLLAKEGQRELKRSGFGFQNFNGWIGHTGRIDGYSSACFYNPQLDASVVVMVNRLDTDDASKKISREIPILNAVVDSFFPGHPLNLR